MGGGVPGFWGPYDTKWTGGGDWAEQLHGEPSTNIERRDLIEKQNDQSRDLVEAMKRTNRLLSGEEPQRLGLLSTQMGGLGAGYGGGGGVGGVSPMGGLPGFGGGGRGGGYGPGGTTGQGTPSIQQPSIGTPFGPSVGRFTPQPTTGRFAAQGARADVVGSVVDEWRKAGMSDAGIAGVLANIKEESNFDPTLRHPDQPHFGGEAHFAHGLYQEGGDEWNHYSRWLSQNAPGADWRDPRLQSKFAAENLRQNYPAVWKRMQEGDRLTAAEAYVRGYLKPAARYQESRVAGFRRGGIPGLESYGTTQPGQEPKITTPRISVTTPQLGPEMLAGPTQLPDLAAPRTGSAGTIIEAQGKEAAVRRGAISPDLRAALQYASAQTGLTVRIASGGQRMEGAPGATGSHRHDRGDAADFDLIDEKGNKVPIDDPRYLDFVTHAARAGVKGGGAAENYMGRYRAHLDIVGGARGGAEGIYTGSRAFREAYERGAASRLTPEELTAALQDPTSKVAGPGAGGRGGPRIETLRVRPTTGEDRAEVDSQLIDQLAARRAAHRAIGSANIDVNVKDHTTGHTNVAQIGPFRKVRTERMAQMTPADSGPERHVAEAGSSANSEE
jgi:hypothetical protein